ncbi:MAG: hypothetical protein JXR97_03780 [Planctomycetes bacterium]|nr:hypothetical protein [Planctomycetota bacterium]
MSEKTKEKTIVLRKDDQWYIISSNEGDEKEILVTLLEYAEKGTYNIEREDVMELLAKLGWQLEVHDNLSAA